MSASCVYKKFSFIFMFLLLSAFFLTACQTGPSAEEQIKVCQDAYEKLMASDSHQMDYTMELPEGKEQSGTYMAHNENVLIRVQSAANHFTWLMTYEGSSYSKRETGTDENDAQWAVSDSGYVSSYGPERLNIFQQDLRLKSAELVDGNTVITLKTEDHAVFTFHIDGEGVLHAVDLEVPAGQKQEICHSTYTFTYDTGDSIEAAIEKAAKTLD